jgi:hypothetical protein
MAKRNANKPKVSAEVLGTLPAESGKQAAVNAAVAEAGGVHQPTAKQMEKARKQEHAYWSGMITRKEAFDLVKGATAQQDEKLRMLYITTNTLLSLVKDLGLATDEKLNELSLPFVELMYGRPPEPEAQKEKEEDTAEATAEVVEGGVPIDADNSTEA